MSNILLSGKDWSKIDNGGLHIETETKELNSIKTSIDLDAESTEAESIEAEFKDSDELSTKVFFPRYKSLSGHELSPVNMGIYQTEAHDVDVLRSTKYIGVMPLIDMKNKEVMRGSVIKISSRFSISPTAMLKLVLEGNDYYENPGMLKTKSYSLSEWRRLNDYQWKNSKERVLFGLINDVEKIDISALDDKASDSDVTKSDMGIADAYGVFEIIDFVNKAKEICKKALKNQSQRVEENLNCKVKGRILIQKQIRKNIVRGQVQKVYCAYNKMSPDIKENQILKYTLHICQKHEIGDALAEDIQFCMRALSGVSLVKCSVSDFVGLKNNGAYRQYKEVLISAKKVLGRYSISYNSAGGNEAKESEKTIKAKLENHKVLPFFIDMNLLFEYYCRALFRQVIDNNFRDYFELEDIGSAKRLLFECDDQYTRKTFNMPYSDGNDEEDDKEDDKENNHVLRDYFMPTYIPDIVILDKNTSSSTNGVRHKNTVAAVIDAKYSDVEKSEKRSRTHQVGFYMNSLGGSVGGLMSPHKINGGEIEKTCVYKDMWVNDDYYSQNTHKISYIPVSYGEGILFKNDAEANDKYILAVNDFLDKLKRTLEVVHEEERQRKLKMELLNELLSNKTLVKKSLEKRIIEMNIKTNWEVKDEQ